MIERILFFILMPIIFEDIMFSYNEKYQGCEEGETCSLRIVTNKYYKYYKTNYNELIFIFLLFLLE